MAKGYWVAHVDVSDPEAYKLYAAAIQKPFAKFGARYLVRGGAISHSEGSVRARTVVIEFPSHEAAVACYQSEDYQKALQFRLNASAGDIAIVEGYDGQQPGTA